MAVCDSLDLHTCTLSQSKITGPVVWQYLGQYCLGSEWVEWPQAFTLAAVARRKRVCIIDTINKGLWFISSLTCRPRRDRRAGVELQIQLSRDMFGVPSNVHACDRLRSRFRVMTAHA